MGAGRLRLIGSRRGALHELTIDTFNELVQGLPTSSIGNLADWVNHVCVHCKALLFKGESSSTCCHNGTTSLPPICTPPELAEFFQRASFIKEIVRWNNAFSMASLGLQNRQAGQADGHSFQGDVAIQGRVYHNVANIIPSEGLEPSFLQLYFIESDVAADVRCRMLVPEQLDEGILATFTQLLQQVNPYIKDIKTALESLKEHAGNSVGDDGAAPVFEGHILITTDCRLLPPNAHRWTYNVPATGEHCASLVQSSVLCPPLSLRGRWMEHRDEAHQHNGF